MLIVVRTAVVTEALPKASVGNGILVLSAWLHFALGNTISQILEVFNFHLQFKISPGGLVQMWHLLRELKRVVQYKDSNGDWSKFSKKIKRLIRDAIRLGKRKDELDSIGNCICAACHPERSEGSKA